MMSIKEKVDMGLLWGSLIAFILIALIKPFSINIVKGASMYPSLEENDIVVTYKYRGPKVGDIATLLPPKDWGLEDKILIKRIIAKGGDTISIKNNHLYINNILLIDGLNEIYDVPIPEITFTVDKDYFLVMGDNYKHSRDSIYFLLSNQFENDFLVPKDSILGSTRSEESEVEEIKNYVKAYHK